MEESLYLNSGLADVDGETLTHDGLVVCLLFPANLKKNILKSFRKSFLSTEPASLRSQTALRKKTDDDDDDMGENSSCSLTNSWVW